MFLNRIKLLINRYLKARSFGFLFFAARYFYIPKSIKINNKIINLNLPDEYGVKITFVEIFLDDTYKLGWIKNFAKKKIQVSHNDERSKASFLYHTLIL